jgi:Ca2+-binding EF-hand superfamily protein
MTATPPSTTPRRLNSNPVESPFPFSSLTTSPQPSQHNKNSNYTSSQLRGITTIFQLFNPTLSGYLDVNTFEVMVLSMGYRVTREEILELVRDIVLCSDERDDSQEVCLQIDENASIIDLSMAIEILSKKGYGTQRNSEEEARNYFGLFDVQNKGYITVEDLKRVQHEAVQLEQEMLNSNSNCSAENNDLLCFTGDVTDEFVQGILDRFDVNSTGAIDFEEFRRIVHPILS